jgi:hypothetical protein
LSENFSVDAIQQLAQKFLNKLYEITEGDEWEEIDVFNIYKEICGDYSPDNVRLRHNVLQCLLADGFIILSHDKSTILITSQGKKYLGKSASLGDSSNP